MNCRGLYFAGNGKGVCPADSVGHTCAPNDRWIWLPREGGGTGVPLAAGESMQAGWRWCPRCQGVFHGPGGSGACPAGNSHVDTGSGHYAVTLGPLVTKTISLNLSAPGLFGDPMYVVADSKGVLRCERPIYLGSQGFALEPSDDGRVLLRWPQNNFYVLVDNATQALVARGGREHATRFTLIPRGGARFHFACEGGSVVVSPKLGDPVTVGPPGGDPRLPRMVIASDARAIGLLNWR